jgi:hypothetical protein
LSDFSGVLSPLFQIRSVFLLLHVMSLFEN